MTLEDSQQEILVPQSDMFESDVYDKKIQEQNKNISSATGGNSSHNSRSGVGSSNQARNRLPTDDDEDFDAFLQEKQEREMYSNRVHDIEHERRMERIQEDWSIRQREAIEWANR